uniref:REC8 meiotic recombination protein b n=1 Tax=Mastacembelus armatus TaxID=205130 RepID=A0A3Q3MXR8_9TELE
MFYYPNVLHRHTGCFSTIWLAATSGIRVTRRELLRVDVKQTCSDILDYVTAQVPPPQPNLPRPRFSLYLSSQLQYGVVLVYHRQCAFLLEETEQAIDRLLRSKRCVHIDIAESDRLCLDVPNNMYMMEEAEGAQDPFFGLMESHQLPSPYNLHKVQFTIQNALKHTCFEGDDLPEATAREIDLLMHQPEQFRRGVGFSLCMTSTACGSLCFHCLNRKATSLRFLLCFSRCHQVVVRPCRRPGGGHRRQLVFADPEVQISNKAIKEQIGNPLIETLDLVWYLKKMKWFHSATQFMHNY